MYIHFAHNFYRLFAVAYNFDGIARIKVKLTFQFLVQLVIYIQWHYTFLHQYPAYHELELH